MQCTHHYWLPSQYDETICTLHHEASELVTQYPLDLIRLLDLDAEPDGVHGWLDEHAFVLVTGDGEGVEEHFLGPAVYGERDGERVRCCVIA